VRELAVVSQFLEGSQREMMPVCAGVCVHVLNLLHPSYRQILRVVQPDLRENRCLVPADVLAMTGRRACRLRHDRHKRSMSGRGNIR
jgi:hypothetical protein